MSWIVDDEHELFERAFSHLFRDSKYTLLRLTDDEAAFDEVRIYVARLLRSKPGGLSHYSVLRNPRPSYQGSEDGTCGTEECPDSQSDDEDKEWGCDVALGYCAVPVDFEGKKVWVWVRTEGPPGADESAKGLHKYTEVVMVTEGADSISLLEKFVSVAYQKVNRTKRKSMSFNLYRWKKKCGYWRFDGSQPGRGADSIILPGNLCERVLSDVEDFLSKETKKWYLSHGIPYKRSYLLYGPPGSGKSSMVRLLATTFQRAVCYLQPSELSDSQLADAVERLPRKGILILEDVDSLFVAGRASRKKSRLTFSGVLNILDGLISPQDGQIIVMTSNHPERLDPAMVRSGRIDQRYELPAPAAEQIKKMFLAFYPEAAQTKEGLLAALTFAEKCLASCHHSPEPLSMASLQNYFILGRKLSFRDFLEALPDFIDSQKSIFQHQETLADDKVDGHDDNASASETSQDDGNSSQNSDCSADSCVGDD